MCGARMSRAYAQKLLSPLRTIQGLLPLALGLLLWQILAAPNSPYFPPPSTWWDSYWHLAAGGRLRTALLSTLGTFALGLLASIAIGFLGGILIGRSRLARRALGPLLEFCRGLPPPVLVPVAVLLLGYSQNLKLLNVVWVACWPILLNTSSAASRIDQLLLDVCRTFHLSPLDRLRKVIAPAVVPDFLIGVRVAIPLAIIITLLVEMMTGLPGIGSMIVTSQRQFRSAEVYGLLVLVGLLGFLINIGFNAVERRILRRWPPLER